MNMVLTDRTAKRCPNSRSRAETSSLGDFMLPSLEVAGPGNALGGGLAGDRVVARRELSATQEMMDAYDEYFEAARTAMHDGATATTSTARFPRASSIVATSSATSPGTRSG